MTTLPTSTTSLSPPPPLTNTRRQLLTPITDKDTGEIIPGHFLLVLDNSSAEKFVTCPQSAYNYLVLGREAQTRSAALTFGGALHAGLEKFLAWQYYNNEDIVKPALPANALQYQRLMEDEQDRVIVKHFAENPLPLELNADYRNVTSCLEVMKHYRFRAGLPDYEWQVMSDANGLVVERAFELPLGVVEVHDWIYMPWLEDDKVRQVDNRNWSQLQEENFNKNKTCWVTHIHIAWSGRIDAVVHAHGMARVVDHKTSSDKRYLNPQKYHLANQTIGYVWAAKQLFPDLDVRGFCLNGIVFKRPTGTGSIAEKGPRGGEPALDFQRYFYEYSDERLTWWQNNAILIVSDFIHCLVRNEFPSHTAWCHGTFGPCPYLEVCEQDNAEMREVLIQSPKFRTVTWNPVKGN